METDVQQTPFLKQLVDSDPAARDKAFVSLRTYLTSGRSFSDLELLKLWKGLFYSLYHTPRTEAQPLITSLGDLSLSLPSSLFLNWSRAFWLTIGAQMPALDANRIDKFLTLQRRMLGAQLSWLARAKWHESTVRDYAALLAHPLEGPLGVGGEDAKIGDGVRYHVLDVFADELTRVAENEREMSPRIAELLLEPVQNLAKTGRGKVTRQKARAVLEDEEVLDLLHPERAEERDRKEAQNGGAEEDDEWQGLDD